MFPEEVAFPVYIGDDRQKPYQLLLELHYDRVPAGGIIDNSGMEFFYTRQKPTNLAGTVTVSIGAIPALVVPPQFDDFTITTTCGSDCTQNVSIIIIHKLYGKYFCPFVATSREWSDCVCIFSS